MYLPQAASLLPTIGAQPDLFRCMHLVWESWFEPTVAAFGTVVRPLHAQLNNSASVCRRGTGPILSRWGPDCPHLVVGLSTGFMNPVHRKVCAWVLYWICLLYTSDAADE